MRKPNVQNICNLSVPIIRRMVPKTREAIGSPVFERNEAIYAWVINESVGEGEESAAIGL